MDPHLLGGVFRIDQHMFSPAGSHPVEVVVDVDSQGFGSEQHSLGRPAPLQDVKHALHDLVAAGALEGDEIQAVHHDRSLLGIRSQEERQVVLAGVSQMLRALGDEVDRFAVKAVLDRGQTCLVATFAHKGLQHILELMDQALGPLGVFQVMRDQLCRRVVFQRPHHLDEDVAGIVERIGILRTDVDNGERMALDRLLRAQLAGIQAGSDIVKVPVLGERQRRLGHLVGQGTQPHDMLQVTPCLLVCGFTRFALQGIPTGGRVVSGFQQPVDGPLEFRRKLGLDGAKVAIMRTLTGRSRDAVQRGEGRKVVPMMGKFLDHRINDVGENAPEFGCLLCHSGQPSGGIRIVGLHADVVADLRQVPPARRRSVVLSQCSGGWRTSNIDRFGDLQQEMIWHADQIDKPPQPLMQLQVKRSPQSPIGRLRQGLDERPLVG